MGAKVNISYDVPQTNPDLMLIRENKIRIRDVWKKLWRRIWIPIDVAEAVYKAVFGARLVKIVEINDLNNSLFEEFNPREEYLKKAKVL